eukprot:TRINITY_DN73_c0_g1_i2.p1 TRINITY_DN73_c0_g1~~TRINITY_DN73_c0_g1_i2.p1  ORF type:complete len:450 (+),score=74.00 TRINITY_DN73_c0_g1_i2:246-1595(+)
MFSSVESMALAFRDLTTFEFPRAASSVSLSVLLWSSVVPVIKVLLIGLLGLTFALPSVNILSEPARRSLAKIIFNAFLPAFIFVRLGEAINLEKLLIWWYIPVNVMISSLVGCALGYIVAVATGAPRELRRISAVLVGIGNQGNLPIVLITAICSDKNNPFGDACDVSGVAYIALGMWTAALIMWGVVYNVLTPTSAPDHSASSLEKLPGEVLPDTLDAALLTNSVHPQADYEKGLLEGFKAEEKEGSRNGQSSKGGAERYSLVSLPEVTRLPVKHWWQRCDLSLFLRPPLLAACAAMVLGIVPWLDHTFFQSDGSMRFFSDTIAILGQALVPCILMVIGGSMAGGPTSSALPANTSVALVVSRMLLVPLFGLGLVYLALRMNLFPADPMFRFALLLQHTMPASLEIGTCCSLHGFGEREVSSILFLQHITAAFSMPLFMLLYLYVLFG